MDSKLQYFNCHASHAKKLLLKFAFGFPMHVEKMLGDEFYGSFISL